MSGAYGPIEWITPVEHVYWPLREPRVSLKEARAKHVTLRVAQPDGTVAEMSVETADLSFQYSTPDGRTGAGDVGLSSVHATLVPATLDWLASLGADRSSEEVRAEAAELAQLLQAARAAPQPSKFRLGDSSSSAGTHFPKWVTAGLLGFWATVWLAGIAAILFRAQQRATVQ